MWCISVILHGIIIIIFSPKTQLILLLTCVSLWLVVCDFFSHPCFSIFVIHLEKKLTLVFCGPIIIAVRFFCIYISNIIGSFIAIIWTWGRHCCIILHHRIKHVDGCRGGLPHKGNCFLKSRHDNSLVDSMFLILNNIYWIIYMAWTIHLYHYEPYCHRKKAYAEDQVQFHLKIIFMSDLCVIYFVLLIYFMFYV